MSGLCDCIVPLDHALTPDMIRKLLAQRLRFGAVYTVRVIYPSPAVHVVSYGDQGSSRDMRVKLPESKLLYLCFTFNQLAETIHDLQSLYRDGLLKEIFAS